MAIPVVNLYRNGGLESTHYGNLAIVAADGKLLYRVGDPFARTFMRSSAKPLQAVSLVRTGGFARLGLAPRHLAIICASHSGEPQHVQAVAEILNRIGLGPEHLRCGVHEPLYYTYTNSKPPAALEISTLHHNCSGKHAGMLALCRHLGYPIENYLDFDHPAQKMITGTIAEICRLSEKEIHLAIDGCSAPVHGMPLYNMALGFARFSAPDSLPADLADSCRTIAAAMIQHPEMVGGTNRYDTELMRTCEGKLIAKVGAEGVHCVGLLGRGLGMACKITDGNRRALSPFSLEALHQWGAVSSTQFESLKGFHATPLRNYRNIEIGELKPEFSLESAGK